MFLVDRAMWALKSRNAYEWFKKSLNTSRYEMWVEGGSGGNFAG